MFETTRSDERTGSAFVLQAICASTMAVVNAPTPAPVQLGA